MRGQGRLPLEPAAGAKNGGGVGDGDAMEFAEAAVGLALPAAELVQKGGSSLQDGASESEGEDGVWVVLD